MENNNNNQQSFWQFSDQLRVHSSNLANLSLNDSIWGNNYSCNKNERRNFDIKVGGEINNNNSGGWKQMNNNNNNMVGVVDVGINGGFNKGVYPNSNPSSYGNFNSNNNLNINFKGLKFGGAKVENENFHLAKSSKKNTNLNKKHGDNNNSNSDGNKNKDVKAASDKRFKTLPPTESLPRNETIGGYIFVCNNDTMAENLKRQLFGMFLYFPFSFFFNYAIVIIIFDLYSTLIWFPCLSNNFTVFISLIIYYYSKK